jgi:hypothetical protein
VKAGAFLAALLLAGCGARGALTPREGASLPPAPVWATARPTAEELLVPPPEAAPARVDDVIRRPERVREDDPFDPPPTRR